MLAKGERGPGTFPTPRGVVGNNQKVWDWAPVQSWFEHQYGVDLGDSRPLTRDEITDVERMLRRTQSDDLATDADINVFYREEDGGYIADIPDLEACSAFGTTPQEALAEVLRAKEAWLAAARARGRQIPEAGYHPPMPA